MRSPIYTTNAKLAEYHDNTPTMTDQSGARDTDINVIVGQFGISGTVPGTQGTAQNLDLTEIPTDLRSMIEKARELNELKNGLPPEYQHLSTEELLTTPPAALAQLTKDASTIRERRTKLPDTLKRTSDLDILSWTDAQFESIITPAQTRAEENK